MKLCGTHLADLALMIKKKNMWSLVATDANESARRAVEWLRGRTQLDNFDPLAISFCEINQKAHQILGMHPEDPRCPLCAVATHLERDADRVWIDNCTDAIYAVALYNELISLR